MITLIDFSEINLNGIKSGTRKVFGFYSVVLKKITGAGVIYGRKVYDFSEAALLCMAPEQLSVVTAIEKEAFTEGWGLYFHPDLIRSSALNKSINSYTFFSYNTDEALHLSEKEKSILHLLTQSLKAESSDKLDNYSTDIIVSNIEVILNHCKRFYGRQFITRQIHNKGIASRFEALLTDYFESGKLRLQGLPSVKYCADQLHLSPNYLGDLLKQESGKSAKDHIHFFLIEKAKNLLLNSSSSITEIAYDLGFGQRQSFSKLFKQKTGMSPSEYKNPE
ncbi:helix-turn-helix domain-containing protein [Sediminicola luteus]|uniref:helix-turn-helix domain-containing protein n=1 Tax=Sediminicola luteus TaxID=319238 RepID=UPI0015571072|nr:helix-turn-helix transcriptional regulator [Sediminicola luteus]